LAELLKNKFDITASDSTVRLHLKSLGLTFQKPEYQDTERDEQEIDYFLNSKFPRIQRLAEKLGADIGFQDESGVGIMTRYGKTWGLQRKKGADIMLCRLSRLREKCGTRSKMAASMEKYSSNF
jgi:hypothetical protein